MMLHRGKRDTTFFHLIAFDEWKTKASQDFPEESTAKYSCLHEEITYVMALGISAKTHPLFLLYCILGINYSTAPQCSDFLLLESFYQWEKKLLEIFCFSFSVTVLCSVKKSIKRILFLWGDISGSKLSWTQLYCWRNYSFALKVVFVTFISVHQMLIIL